MGIGIGILFIAVGAILAFAVEAEVNGIDIAAVGVILMIVGALGIVLDLVLFAPRRRRSEVVQTTAPAQVVQPAPGQVVQQAPPQTVQRTDTF